MVEYQINAVDGDVIFLEHLPENIRIAESYPLTHDDNKTLSDILDETENRVLQQARKRYKSTTKMAKHLGVSQPTIVRKLQKYGL